MSCISMVKPTRCTILRVYWISLCMFWTVSPSIIRSSRLYTQHQAYVLQVSWLPASGHEMELSFHLVYHDARSHERQIWWVIVCKHFKCQWICHIIFSVLTVLFWLNCINKTIQVTDGRKYFPRGPHIGQPCCRVFSDCFCIKLARSVVSIVEVRSKVTRLPLFLWRNSPIRA